MKQLPNVYFCNYITLNWQLVKEKLLATFQIGLLYLIWEKIGNPLQIVFYGVLHQPIPKNFQWGLFVKLYGFVNYVSRLHCLRQFFHLVSALTYQLVKFWNTGPWITRVQLRKSTRTPNMSKITGPIQILKKFCDNAQSTHNSWETDDWQGKYWFFDARGT